MVVSSEDMVDVAVEMWQEKECAKGAESGGGLDRRTACIECV
jgi:hypothetical protein